MTDLVVAVSAVAVALAQRHLTPRETLELRMQVRDDGFKGVRVLPWLWETPPTDRRFFPLYAACVELGYPLLRAGRSTPGHHARRSPAGPPLTSTRSRSTFRN